MSEAVIVCMVDLCRWSNNEGGCNHTSEHVLIGLVDGKAHCDGFEYKPEYCGIAKENRC